MNAMRAGLMTILAAVCLAGTAQAQNYELPPGVVGAYPTPNTTSASPRTEISFRGRALTSLGSIRVTGSRTGRHTGRLVKHSDRNGVSFLPSKPFRGGERVTVRTSLPIARHPNGDFGFTIGRIPPATDIAQRFLERTPPGKRERFRSRPDLTPPVMTVYPERSGPGEPGYVITSPKSKIDVSQAGPMISDKTGGLIWFQPLPGINAATDVRVQTYRGQPVLTYWEGTSRQGIGYGRLVIRDDRYRVIKRLQTPNGYRADLHEFLITPNNTALVIAYPAVRANLKALKGAPNGQVIDSVIQEIDIATGRVVFEWHSLGEVRLGDTFSKPIPSPRIPFDYFHANSVSLDDDGDILVSARNTWGIYKIDRLTGRLEWTLGGKRSTFKMPPAARFAWQHDARRRADGAITLFDNEAFPPIRKTSRVMAMKLDEKAKTASVISSWEHPRKLLAATQGNHQTLPTGGAFVGWGSQRHFTEYGRAGKVLWDARLAVGYETYRAYLSPWVGRPDTRPRVAGIGSKSGVVVFASWNGSTETASWEFLSGKTPSTLKVVGARERTGFETSLLVPGRDRYVAARARDAAGNVLAQSPAQRVAE
jgi:hypothetical protein